MLWQMVLCLVIAWLIIDNFYNKYVHRAIKNIPEVDFAWFPLIGHAYMVRGNNEDRMNCLKKIAYNCTKLGGMSKIWFGRRLYLVVTDAKIAEEIARVFLAKEEALSVLRSVSETGSISAPVPVWRPRRKLINPAFSSHNLKHFMPIFAEGSDTMVRLLEEDCVRSSHKIWTYVNTYTLDVLCRSTLGINLHVQRNPTHPYCTAMNQSCAFVAERMFKIWLQIDWLYRLLPHFKQFQEIMRIQFHFLNKIINVRRMQRTQESDNKSQPHKNSGTEYNRNRSLLDILLDSAETGGISDKEIRDECLIVTVAGSETTAITIGFVLSLLARHPDVQIKVFEEIQSVFDKSKQIQNITSRDLMELNYLDAVIRETLRLYPPAPIICRKVDSYEKLSTLPTPVLGTRFAIHVWGIHRNPKYWGPDAEEFRPDRFLDNSVRHPAAFMPFSSGPRNCIGYQYAMLSMKTAIANIVRNFHISLPNDCHIHGLSSQRNSDCASCKVEPIKLAMSFLMKDSNGFNLKLERRM